FKPTRQNDSKQALLPFPLTLKRKMGVFFLYTVDAEPHGIFTDSAFHAQQSGVDTVAANGVMARFPFSSLGLFENARSCHRE
ncbi:MAG: hypothetical protein KA250_16640, partial [Verrucomicrobiales bacterium]|nr:hypothetical protein [Verrucomicrobiales bacterium]